jgi:hypothetical protein
VARMGKGHSCWAWTTRPIRNMEARKQPTKYHSNTQQMGTYKEIQ